MAEMLLYIFLAGFLVGITKYITGTPAKKRKVRKDWMVLTLLSSGGLGLMAGVFIAEDIKFALVAGYAGTDFLENLFKIKMKKVNWD